MSTLINPDSVTWVPVHLQNIRVANSALFRPSLKENMTHAVFISYRRDDAEGQSGRLYRDLTEHFGSEAVFMDVDAIEAGTDFRQEIDRQLATCSVLLAVIGKSWLDSTDMSGSRRLDDPTDFVRIETAAALKRGIPVVPVLVQGARMPRVEDLPDGLKELAFRHGIELAHARWNSDVQLLVKALQVYVQPKYPTAASTGSSSTGRIIRSTGGGLLGLLFIGAI